MSEILKGGAVPLDASSLVRRLVIRTQSKIVFVVMDGLGGFPKSPAGKSELMAANHPHLDALAASGCVGLLDPVFPGITPGSGPGHLGLFGYDPLEHTVGRGALSAAGTGFDLRPDDIAARVNICTLDDKGNVVDRRAGRLPTDETAAICSELERSVQVDGAEVFFRPEKDHRALLVVRGSDLSDALQDTDPQRTGVPPLEPQPVPEAEHDPRAKATAALIAEILRQARSLLAHRSRGNFLLLRGFARRPHLQPFSERYGLRALALSQYPMYLGLARLLGMDDLGPQPTMEAQLSSLTNNFDKYDFFYFHVKATDAAGEDGDFERKCKAIEEVDSTVIPHIRSLEPDVIVVTGDHSTPASEKAHSWHPVPVLLAGGSAPVDPVEAFDEISCLGGFLGRRRAVELFPIVLAAAGRLKKFGA
jgi:2,3-bisphosphoglycerate-independent phosphoglycerate mutase